jgi:hypothetical protein
LAVILAGCGWYESDGSDESFDRSESEPTEPGSGGEGSSEGTGGEGPEGSGGGSGNSMTTTSHGISGFDVQLGEGTFWDYRWRETRSSFGTGSTGEGTFRVWLAESTEIEGVTAYRMITGGKGDRPRWRYLAFEDGVLYGSLDGLGLEPIMDTSTGVWLGGGFFAELADRVVYAVRSGSFSNSLMSGSGVIVERSASESDTVCANGVCVNGSKPEVNLRESEFYQNGIGPVGYDYLFSFSDQSSQGTTQRAIALVATSLRGDAGLFEVEVEPNDASHPRFATVDITRERSILGNIQGSDESFFVSKTYFNRNGLEIGTADDTLYDCYGFTAPSPPELVRFRMDWDEEQCSSCRASMVMFDYSDEPVYSSSLFQNSDGGYETLNVFDNYFTGESSRYTVCVGISYSVTPLDYSLQWE